VLLQRDDRLSPPQNSEQVMPDSETKPLDGQHLTTISSAVEKAKEKLKKKPLTEIVGFYILGRQSSGLKI